MRFLIVVCLIVFISVVRTEYPAHIPKCKNGDVPCLTKVANEFLQKYSSGLKEVNLLPFDPLRVKLINLERDPSSPVNIGIKLKDVDLFGLKGMKVSSFDGLKADLKGRTVWEAVVPELTIKGHYNIDGRVILLPIVGDGECEIKIRNIKIRNSFDLKSTEKNGKIYASLEHVKLEMNPDYVHFYFGNLFNGDKTLGDNMNAFMNDNWKEVYTALEPGVTKSISLVVKSMMNSFFEKYPYSEYFQ